MREYVDPRTGGTARVEEYAPGRWGAVLELERGSLSARLLMLFDGLFGLSTREEAEKALRRWARGNRATERLPETRVFGRRELAAAIAFAAEGGQALHLHRVLTPGAPRCFRAAVARGEDVAHLFDRDPERLARMARSLGVRVVMIHGEGPRRHVDLCGAPLREALRRAGEKKGEGRDAS